MTPITVGSTEYKRLARTYAWLLSVKNSRSLMEHETRALQRINEAMTAAEMAHSAAANTRIPDTVFGHRGHWTRQEDRSIFTCDNGLQIQLVGPQEPDDDLYARAVARVDGTADYGPGLRQAGAIE